MLFNLFRKAEDAQTNNEKFLTLKVREVVRETSDTVTIYFEQPEPHLDYKPGQFLTIILEINGKEERRSYSLCTSPFVDPFPGITVKKVKGGVVSRYLNENIFPGKKISVLKPLGNFTTDYHSQNERHYWMIVGGSGITPIMGITKSILVNEPNSKVSMLYCSRSEEHIIFKKSLEDLQEKFRGKLFLINNLTQPSEGWTGYKGRVNAEIIKRFYAEHFSSQDLDLRVFLCGPEGLMDTAKGSLLELGVSNEFIKMENFYLKASPNSDTAEKGNSESPQPTREVTVLLEGQEFKYDVTPDKTILEAGLEEDLDMPYSCQSGLCTACRGRLISGKVQMEEDAGLSENEINEGYILCCSSKPVSSDVKIKIE